MSHTGGKRGLSPVSGPNESGWKISVSPVSGFVTKRRFSAMVPSCRVAFGKIMMASTSPHSSVKVVGANGQISLGKQFAGRQVLVEEREPGVWLVRTATVVPDNERWLHQASAAVDLQKALAWAQANPPAESDMEALGEQISGQD